jgi:SAM-dependent methyltransferase
MKTEEEARALVRDLAASTWQLAVISACVEGGLVSALAAGPRSTKELHAATRLREDMIDHLLDVLAAQGLAARDGAGMWSLAPGAAFLAHDWMLHDLRVTRQQSRAMIDQTRARDLTPGWQFTDPEILESQGKSGGGALDMLRKLVSALDGLDARFAAGGRFLDVGAGVGAMDIALCGLYPTIHCVGLEPADAPIAEARKQIAAAGFTDRIELRQIFVQDLRDDATYDLAWVPQPFLPPDVYPVALRTVFRALKPGGWLFTLASNESGSPLALAMNRLRVTMWGGGTISPDRVKSLLAEVGYTEARHLPAPGPVIPVFARRPHPH